MSSAQPAKVLMSPLALSSFHVYPSPLPFLADCPWEIHVLLTVLFRATCLFYGSYCGTPGLIPKGSAKQSTLHGKGFKVTPTLECCHRYRSKCCLFVTLFPMLHSYKTLIFKFKGSACPSSPA